jgi:hypothetical protein
MKLRRKNRSVFFRGIVLATAFAFSIICFPTKEIVATASTLNSGSNADYTYLTIGTKSEKVQTTVTKGGTYVIPKAYIGGVKTNVVGTNLNGTSASGNVTLTSSKVSVKYSSQVLGSVKDGAAVDSEDKVVSTDAFVTISGNEFSFTASKVGSYTVTYSYSYKINDVEYTNSYDLTVTSEISDADISFDDNSSVIMPSILDLKQARKSDYSDSNKSYKDLSIALPTITDANGKVVDTEDENFEYITQTELESADSGKTIGGKAKQLLIRVDANTATTDVEVSGDAESGYYIAGSVFADAQHGAGKYTVTYSYYENGEFVASTTKSTQVYSEGAYYKEYALRLQLDSDFTDNGQTGVSTSLPTASGLTSTSSDPASEAVDIYYTVTVYYKTTSSGKYALLDTEKYNSASEKVINDDGTLVDPASFKPLEDGYYTFVYEAYDFYYDASLGKDASANKNHYFKTDRGSYEYVNITDEKAPTPTVYVATKDGSLDDEDASSKIATRAYPESVVIYAIGMDDNVERTAGDGSVLTRKIMTDETVTKITLSSDGTGNSTLDYSDYNLIFNYNGKDGLKKYNYLIAKQMADVENTEIATLEWLAENKYLIVVDNANYKTIYELYKDLSVFGADVVDEATALTWFKSEDALKAGFAYVNVDKTFGATAGNSGMGTGQYIVHYIAKDAAGNETDVTKKIYIRDFTDTTSPEITFSTSLSDSYLPTATITFDAPTASDNIDENMDVKVLYRYLNSEGAVVEVLDDDENPISKVDLDDLWTDLNTKAEDGVKDDDGVLLTTKYSKYHNLSEGANDGYVDISDASATSYSIDLSKAAQTATKLQILVYTYDDAGNPTIYGQTIDVRNVSDQYPPQLKSVKAVESDFVTTYEQGATITLPEVVVMDDVVGYMTFDVKIDYIKEGTRYERSVREASADRKNQGSVGTFTVTSGNFVAADAGQYQASIIVKDVNDKTIVVFLNYTVTERATVEQSPTVSSTLESQTIELDDKETIEIPTPTVNFELDNSVTYDDFVDAESQSDKTYVIRGINSDGKATDWTTNNRLGTVSSFVADKVGEYEIQYSAKVDAYNHSVLSYNEGSVKEELDGSVTYTEGGYYTYKETGAEITVVYNDSDVVSDEYRLKVGGNYYVVKNEENGVVVYAADSDYVIEKVEKEDGEGYVDKVVDKSSLSADINFDTLFKDLRAYNLKSDIITITVNDNNGPVLANYDYSKQSYLSVDDFKNNGGITIYGIQATDASGIDLSKSQISLSWKRANGTSTGDSGSRTWSGTEAAKDITYNSSASNLNGTYTITYTVYDNNGNSTTKEYKISVGDDEAPKITFPDEFVASSYTLNDKLVLDFADVEFTDNKGIAADATPTVTLTNTSTGETVDFSIEGTKYIFDSFKDYGEGTYELSVSIEDEVGHVTTETFSFDVSTKNKESTQTYKVVGTILIVISVLVLAGVIVYFIVSKVKLDKELKK